MFEFSFFFVVLRTPCRYFCLNPTRLRMIYARTVVSTIIQKGRVSRPLIGITFLESARANTVGIQKGVLVLDVKENTSAASSGLRPTTRTQVGKAKKSTSFFVVFLPPPPPPPPPHLTLASLSFCLVIFISPMLTVVCECVDVMSYQGRSFFTAVVVCMSCLRSVWKKKRW